MCLPNNLKTDVSVQTQMLYLVTMIKLLILRDCLKEIYNQIKKISGILRPLTQKLVLGDKYKLYLLANEKQCHVIVERRGEGNCRNMPYLMAAASSSKH